MKIAISPPTAPANDEPLPLVNEARQRDREARQRLAAGQPNAALPAQIDSAACIAAVEFKHARRQRRK